MPAEMSFAQALTEARQIIVQQSNRIKSDLEKIKQLQETVAQHIATIGDHERSVSDQQGRIDFLDEQVRMLTSSLEEATTAREQADQIIDRQGQRISQLQDAMSEAETERDANIRRISQLEAEADSLRNLVPTDEDAEALAALSSLLSTKKINVPAIGKNGPVIKLPEPPQAAAA